MTKSDRIKNAILRAIAIVNHENNMNMSIANVKNESDYIYSLFSSEVINYYIRFKRYTLDYDYCERLFTLALKDSFENIAWFTDSKTYKEMIVDIINIVAL